MFKFNFGCSLAKTLQGVFCCFPSKVFSVGFQSESHKSVEISVSTRVSHITPFFELSLVLLTTKALGLYEFTKKISAL